eukprot:Em0033g3a
MIFVTSIALLLHLGVALGRTVHVPSGSASSLGTYLCNGSLTSGTTLILDSGTHIIPTGPACYLTDLSNVAITTSSNATVQCTGERMFHFRGMQNFTIENVTFTECGQLATMRVQSRKVTWSVVLYLDSSSVSMRGVAITRFKGFAVVGYNLINFVMSDVKISGCANNNCSGVYLESALDTVTSRGITMFGLHARVHNTVFTSNQGAFASNMQIVWDSVYAANIYKCQSANGGTVSPDDIYDKYFTIFPAPGDCNQTQVMSFPVKVLICSCLADLGLCCPMTIESPNSICNGGREGVLCGRCPAGQSVVFGSPECHLCSDHWLITLVTQGTIYGLIFYANIIVVNSTVFFGGLDLKFLQVIISFIILDLGFPLCFYNGMDDAAKMGLQFAFPTYLLFLIIIFIVVCHHCISSQPQHPSTKLLENSGNYSAKRCKCISHPGIFVILQTSARGH